MPMHSSPYDTLVRVKMQRDDRLARSKDFLAMSKTLLLSGEFSDVTITCRGKTWKLHQAIICPRSTFFQKAFQGNFKEATAKSLELKEIDPELFDYVVNYLYTGDCDWASLGHDNTNPFALGTQLCIVADYFSLDSMILDICTYLREYYRPVAESIQRAFRGSLSSSPPELMDKRHGEFLEKYIEGAKTAFDDETPGLNPVRSIFLRFISDTAYCVLRDQTFIKALQTSEALSLSAFNHLFAEGSTFLDLLPSKGCMIPSYCVDCSKTYPYTGTWVTTSDTRGRCWDCQELVIRQQDLEPG
ncbi:BTB/POZ protein, partial [Ilyonectria sp. MPI-CAGE-AT-0026]